MLLATQAQFLAFAADFNDHRIGSNFDAVDFDMRNFAFFPFCERLVVYNSQPVVGSPPRPFMTRVMFSVGRFGVMVVEGLELGKKGLRPWLKFVGIVNMDFGIVMPGRTGELVLTVASEGAECAIPVIKSVMAVTVITVCEMAGDRMFNCIVLWQELGRFL